MATTPQGGSGIGWTTKPLIGNENCLSLQAGEVYIPPAGQFYINTGPYSVLQVKDPISGLWRSIGNHPGQLRYVTTDGANVRVANLTGCAVGAVVTNVGSGYTSAPAVAASAGGSTWTAIVGGAINSTVTVTAAGSGYLFPPQVVFSAPPAGGIQATGYCTLSAGAISSVTVVNQGAGYITAPTATVVNDPRDTAGSGGVLTVNATLAGAGTITAVTCTDPGTPQTAVPTLSFSGGGGASAAATVVMCFVATGFTVGAGGAAYGNAQPFGILTIGGTVTATPGAVVNPEIGTALFTPRQATISGTSTAGGAITATGAVINDAGMFQSVPNALVIAGGSGLATTVGQATITVGGIADMTIIQPIG